MFWDAGASNCRSFGGIAHKICLARFARTMASLVRQRSAGSWKYLGLCQTVGNVIMENALRRAATDIERGEGISNALSKASHFPTMIIRMMTAASRPAKLTPCWKEWPIPG